MNLALLLTLRLALPAAALDHAAVEAEARALVLERFPALAPMALALEEAGGSFDLFSASVRKPWRAPERRVYVLRVSRRLFDDPPPREAVRAALVHELAHLESFTRMTGLELATLGLRYAAGGEGGFAARYERATDEKTLRMGFGPGLKAYRLWLYQRLGAIDAARKRRLYYTPEEIDAKPASAAKNVVLVTLDGVRREEFFADAPKLFLPKLRRREKEGVVLGDLSRGSSMKVSNLMALSLPAYQSIMAGGMTRCLSNDCGRVKAQTVIERLADELAFTPAQMRVVAGWSGVPLAAERAPGAAIIDAPPAGSRSDAATWAAGKKALESKPRFLWLAFNDPDARAHAGDYEGYLQAIRLCDGWLDELFAWLDASGDYGRATAVLVTTDHGRGEGPDYASHGGRMNAARVWLYARGAGIVKGGRLGAGKGGTHANIRSTIEALYGLAPSASVLPGVLAP